MFKQVVKKAITIMISFLNLKNIKNVNPYAVEWAIHFAMGSKKPKRLPEQLLPTARNMVLEHLCWLNQEVRFKSHTVSAGAACETEDYYTSALAGVVGAFNIKCQPSNKGIKVQCYDTWDFNTKGKMEQFEVPKFVALVAMKMGVKVDKVSNKYYLREENLAILNNTHEFKTTWEHFFEWDELPYGNEEIDWELLMPKWALIRLSYCNALKELGFKKGNIYEGKPFTSEIYILPRQEDLNECFDEQEWYKKVRNYGTGDWSRKVKVSWSLINKMRENPSKIRWDNMGSEDPYDILFKS